MLLGLPSRPDEIRTTMIATTRIATLAEISRKRRALADILILVSQGIRSVLGGRLRTCLLALGFRFLGKDGARKLKF